MTEQLNKETVPVTPPNEWRESDEGEFALTSDWIRRELENSGPIGMFFAQFLDKDKRR